VVATSTEELPAAEGIFPDNREHIPLTQISLSAIPSSASRLANDLLDQGGKQSTIPP
jgi:hypothetical protein